MSSLQVGFCGFVAPATRPCLSGVYDWFLELFVATVQGRLVDTNITKAREVAECKRCRAGESDGHSAHTVIGGDR